MTKATATFLLRLRKFLENAPPAKREELSALYRKLTGKPLDRRTLDHWLAVDRGITLCCALPLLRFMQLNDQIVPGTKDTGLFHYAAAAEETKKKTPAAPPARSRRLVPA
jgi:hypothetical protein